MKGYKDYKCIDLLWLKTIPEHWEIKRAKTIFEKVNRPVKDSDDTVTCFRDGVVTLRKNRRTSGFTESMKEIGYQGVKKGDLVIHQMDAFAGAIGVSDSDGKSTPVYSVCIPKMDTYNNYYYAYIVREMAKTGFIQSLYRGIRERSSDFRFETFGKQIIPIPPRPEQDQIVKFLDSKISKINKFIKDKKREIELLKELKQAEINRAVTKGLNPNAPMKDSGIEWLGKIPEHWELKYLRNILKITSTKNRPDLPLLSVVREKGVIQRDVLSKEENHNFIPDDLSGYKMVLNGQFVINKMKAWQGSFGVSNFEGIVSPAYYIFDLNFPNKVFFHIAIRSRMYVNFFAQYSGGIRVGQWDLSSEKMKLIPFFVPPVSEQNNIIEYIDRKFKIIDEYISKLENELNLVQEYKTSLISEVVTGKVDVRDIKVDDVIEQEILEIDEAEMETEELMEE